MRRLHVRAPLISLALLALSLLAPTCPNDPNLVMVFGGEGNRLNAFDKQAGYAKETPIPSGSEGGLDINAQICFFPDGSGWFIAGEDTGQPVVPAGFGIFQLQGTPGAFSANQLGKLTPTYQPQEVFQPENYGCGFLSDGRVLTTDVGDQYPPLPGNGQLILWFPPFDVWSDAPYLGDDKVSYCKLDVAIETAGGIYVDENDNVYVASNRPSLDPNGNVDPTTSGPGGVIVYRPPFPTSNAAAGGCGQLDVTGAPLADSVDKELIIPANHTFGVLTASAVAEAPNGNLYVSSVFSGRIAEFELGSLNASLGIAERYIVEPPFGESLPFPTNGTPFGLGVDPDDGQVYYADLGISANPFPGPVGGEGDVYRVPFDATNTPQAPIAIDSGRDFPDGIGVLDRAVLVSPSPVVLRTGAQQQFTTVLLGLSGEVVWSVEEGAAGGSIDANSGLYTAPAVRPADGRAHVVATSVVDSSVIGRAPVHIRHNTGR